MESFQGTLYDFQFQGKNEKIINFTNFFIFQGTDCNFESKYERNRRPLD